MWPPIVRRVAPRLAPHRRYRPIEHPRRLGRALYPGEPETCRRSLRQFLPILAHLGLLLAVFKLYNLEGRAFQLLVALALAALPIHYLLPYRWKRPFFLALSVAGLIGVLGPVAGGIIVALSAVLIGVCFLPIAWTARAALIATMALAFGLARAGIITTPIPDIVWPMLASMFMFRMIIYLYELKHAPKREPLSETLGYFFLLPNYCFPLFPVVDYRTFQRGYFAGEIHETQRAGLTMMFRGTTHLLLYRLIYHQWLIRPEEVHNLASLLGFLVCNYLVYLHVSGQFHLACGLLHLFGFRLPETHHHYLLASSFTDYWRRINIYWKDFMVRLVFNPVAFRLKRWPQPVSLAIATAIVFLATWLLHAYQWFWLRGTWAFSLPDALFWGILGVLVLINVQIDAKAPRRRLLKGLDRSPRALALRALKTVGTFATITLLWSLWTSPSVGAWLGMFRRAVASD
jgi:alginate O-acetyltransferase complex protein AlgI